LKRELNICGLKRELKCGMECELKCGMECELKCKINEY